MSELGTIVLFKVNVEQLNLFSDEMEKQFAELC